MAEEGVISDLSTPDYVTVEQRVLQDNINLVDAKSGILMAISGGLIARDLDKFFELATASSAWSIATVTSLILYAVALAGLFLTAYFTWFVLRPRLVKTNDYVYWSSEAFLHGEKHYIDLVHAATPEKLRHHFLQHIYVLALICRRKFAFFVSAMRAAEISLLTTLAAEIARYVSYAPQVAHGSLAQGLVELFRHMR